MATKKLYIATQDGPREVDAVVVKLYVGSIQERFFIHDSGAETVLSHYDSGYRVGALGPIKMRHAVAWGTGGAPNDREAARLLLNDAVARNGADIVKSKLKAAPVINPK